MKIFKINNQISPAFGNLKLQNIKKWSKEPEIMKEFLDSKEIATFAKRYNVKAKLVLKKTINNRTWTVPKNDPYRESKSFLELKKQEDESFIGKIVLKVKGLKSGFFTHREKIEIGSKFNKNGTNKGEAREHLLQEIFRTKNSTLRSDYWRTSNGKKEYQNYLFQEMKKQVNDIMQYLG